ncbi:MAG TPA: LLM class flavin-dependent oxidoreductase [Rubricoccaceae bacterium]|jgi:luciferase family oxidoreductase group 1
MSLPLSVLDLAPVPAGTAPAEALRATADLARLADALGYTRLWYAEHHSMPGIASSAPEILIAHAAAATERIRVGSGGIMMQNHVPLKLAESFRTLAGLYPGRIDLGVGRAPGTNAATSHALRAFEPDAFAGQLAELRAYTGDGFPEGHPFHRVQAVPTGVTLPPVWLLGSSGASAAFAGANGLGYAFASHFSPAPAAPALRAYRSAFTPSEAFPEPHAILAVAVVCAETPEEADYLAASMDLSWIRLQRGEFGPFPTPGEALAYAYTPAERESILARRALGITGTPEQVRDRIEALVADAGADEVMVTTMVHDAGARQRSYRLLAEAFALDRPAR